MKKINLENVYCILDEYIPEFGQYKDHLMWYGENPYLHVGTFADFFLESVKIDDQSSSAQKSFKFLNDLFNDTEIDSSVKEMFHIQVFEVLAQSNKTINIMKKNLHGEALDSFMAVLKDFTPVE